MDRETLTQEYDVTPALTAREMGSGDMEVLATPALVAMMEHTAMLLAAPRLADGQTTVGTRIETDHRHPTAVGRRVRVTAALTGQEGRKLLFELRAEDDAGLIAEARHERVVVTRDRFLARLAR